MTEVRTTQRLTHDKDDEAEGKESLWLADLQEGLTHGGPQGRQARGLGRQHHVLHYRAELLRRHRGRRTREQLAQRWRREAREWVLGCLTCRANCQVRPESSLSAGVGELMDEAPSLKAEPTPWLPLRCLL